MVGIIIDRLLNILLRLRYPIYFNFSKSKRLATFTWIIGTIICSMCFDDALKISILCFGVLTLLRLSLLYICTHVTYVTFDTDLNLCSTKKYWLISNRCTSTCLSFVASGLFILSECNNEQIVFTKLGLSQLISEPRNFEPHKNPSCIDLVVTDQPNFILDCGTRVSLDSYCHHQIIHCKVNFSIPPPLPYERKLWHFNRANSAAIKRSMTSFPWRQHLNVNTDPSWQVKTFTDTFLNIMSSFVPNETKRFVPRNPPWITKPLKTMLNRKNRLFKNYKRHGYKAEDKVRIDGFRIECQQAVETAKLSYLTNLGNKVNSPGTSQKSYC